jgi:hypothetical protein
MYLEPDHRITFAVESSVARSVLEEAFVEADITVLEYGVIGGYTLEWARPS